MSKVVKAEYDAAENVLRLVEPLDGVQDHATVDVTVMPSDSAAKLSGSLSEEAGASLARAVEELFPTEK